MNPDNEQQCDRCNRTLQGDEPFDSLEYRIVGPGYDRNATSCGNTVTTSTTHTILGKVRVRICHLCRKRIKLGWRLWITGTIIGAIVAVAWFFWNTHAADQETTYLCLGMAVFGAFLFSLGLMATLALLKLNFLNAESDVAVWKAGQQGWEQPYFKTIETQTNRFDEDTYRFATRSEDVIVVQRRLTE